MDEIVNYFETLLNYAKNSAKKLNAASQKALASLMSQVMEVIESQVQGENAEQEVPNITPSIEPAGHVSAQINGFNYDPNTQQLNVKFQGDFPQENGAIYSYEKVPKYIFDLFARGAVAPKTTGSNAWHAWKKGLAPSLGASMNALIKGGGYKYEKIG